MTTTPINPPLSPAHYLLICAEIRFGMVIGTALQPSDDYFYTWFFPEKISTLWDQLACFSKSWIPLRLFQAWETVVIIENKIGSTGGALVDGSWLLISDKLGQVCHCSTTLEIVHDSIVPIHALLVTPSSHSLNNNTANSKEILDSIIKKWAMYIIISLHVHETNN